MIVYVARRLLAAVPVLLGVSLVVFSMLHFLPGDPVLLMMSETRGSGAKMAEMSQETYERIRHELGLDRPLPVQFGLFLWRAVHGDLGRSFRGNQRVATLIGEVVPVHGAAHPGGPGAWRSRSASRSGTLAAVRAGVGPRQRHAWPRRCFAVSMPSFWFGIMLLLVFALHLDIFCPRSGHAEPRRDRACPR